MKTASSKSTTTTPASVHTAGAPFFAKTQNPGFFPASSAGAPKVQMKMNVNQPGDKFEKEADKTADEVMSTSDAPASALAGAPNTPGVQRSGEGTPAISGATQTAIRNKTTGGQPLPREVRSFMEQRFQADFGNVRVHTGPEAAALTNQLNARAFTYQNHIFFSKNQYQPQTGEGRRLLAHELTHTIQQGHSAQRALQPQVTTASDAPMLQRESDESWGDWVASGVSNVASGVSDFAGDVVDTVSGTVDSVANALANGASFVADMGWSLLEQYAPDLVPILRMGPLVWLRQKIGDAVQSIFDNLMAPVQALTGIAPELHEHFNNLIAWVRQAASRIAQGDCGAITEAAELLREIFEALAAPVIDKIKELAKEAKDFFNDIWETFGAPVWDFLQQLGGAIWESIQEFGRWCWEQTAPIREALSAAWTWFKNLLGVGEGPEGQDGIIQWIQREAQSIWDTHFKPVYERYRTQILVAVAILAWFSPVGPLLQIGLIIGGLAWAIRWIRENLSTREGVVEQKDVLRNVVIPSILSSIESVSAFLTDKAGMIAEKMTQLVGALNDGVKSVSASVLSFAAGLLEWLVEKFGELAAWAIEKLFGAVDMINSALESFGSYLIPLLNFLEEVAGVIRDIMRLPFMLAGELWSAIPACIREPFIDFFIPLVLRQIPFFSQLAATPEIWQQTRNDIMELVEGIFINFDLMGAIRAAFRLLVRILNIPVELIVELIDKAAQAFDAVIAAPLTFIENSLKAILMGMGNFMMNILSHLWFGIQGWLLNAISNSGVAPPASWSPRDLFTFVLDIMGISVDHVIELIDRRVPGMGRHLNRARAMLATAREWFTGAMEWIQIAMEEGPSGLWEHLVEKLSDIGTTILESAVGWVMERVIAIVGSRIAALAASGGWSAILEAILAAYAAIKAAIEYMPRILQMMIRAFDAVSATAAGVLGPAADAVENAMRMGMPVVIGFLANYAGLGGISERIREIIGGIREKVDEAILGLIDRVVGALRSLYDRLRRGVQAIVNWWNAREEFELNDESHSIFFVGEGEGAELNVESQRKTIRNFLDQDVRPNVPSDHAKFGNIALIEADISEIERIKRDTSYGQAAGRDINKKLANIARLLGELGLGVPKTEIKTQTTTTLPDGSLVGDEVLVEPLTIKPPDNSAGSAPFQTTPTWTAVNQRSYTYVRGHLLNHHLYGPGENKNLTPITRTMNTGGMSNNFEEPTKEVVLGNNGIVRYKVKMHYDGHPTRRYIPEESYLPTAVEMKSEELEKTDNGFRTKRVIYSDTLTHELPPDTPASTVPKLHRLSVNNPQSSAQGAPDAKSALTKLDQIGDARADLILDNKPFGSWGQINTLVNVTQNTNSIWFAKKSEADQTSRMVYLNGPTEWR